MRQGNVDRRSWNAHRIDHDEGEDLGLDQAQSHSGETFFIGTKHEQSRQIEPQSVNTRGIQGAARIHEGTPGSLPSCLLPLSLSRPTSPQSKSGSPCGSPADTKLDDRTLRQPPFFEMSFEGHDILRSGSEQLALELLRGAFEATHRLSRKQPRAPRDPQQVVVLQFCWDFLENVCGKRHVAEQISSVLCWR